MSDVPNATQLATLGWAVNDGDRGRDGAVDQIQWLDDGRYLAEFRARGGRTRDEPGDVVSSLTLWDVWRGPLASGLLSTVAKEHGNLNTVVYPATGFALSPDSRTVAELGPRRSPQTWTVAGDFAAPVM
jgi:hypothetical protein